jgi:hypothetical protein
MGAVLAVGTVVAMGAVVAVGTVVAVGAVVAVPPGPQVAVAIAFGPQSAVQGCPPEPVSAGGVGVGEGVAAITAAACVSAYWQQ